MTPEEFTTLAQLIMSNAKLTANVASLTASITALTSAYTLLANALAPSTMPPMQPPSTQKASTLDPNGYCWMHGYHIKIGHSSATCTKRLDNHKPYMMQANPMGG